MKFEDEVDTKKVRYDDLVRKEWVGVAEEKEIIPEQTKSKDTEKKL